MPKTTDRLRLKIVEKVKQLRLRERWTQARLAGLLGLSQNRLSEIEHGQGSFTAEQLLLVLKTFNVPLSYFVESEGTGQAKLQNALARLGARHLQESPDILPTEKLENAQHVIREVLIAAESPRHITALAPVIVSNISRLNFDKLRAELTGFGHFQRWGWLLENVFDAVSDEIGYPAKSLPNEWRKQCELVDMKLRFELARLKLPSDAQESILEKDIIPIAKSLEEIRKERSKISLGWKIISRIQPRDFIEALRSARGGR